MNIISQSFIHLKKLNKLSINIEFNSIGEDGACSIGKGLQQLENLTDLSLIIRSFNDINTNGVIGLSQGVSQLISLKYLLINIEFNQIGTKGAISLSEAISKLTQLQKLSLSIGNGNLIQKEGGQAIGNCLSSLKSLTHLQIIICDNDIETEGAKSIGIGIKSIKNLQKLVLIIECNEIMNFGFNMLNQGIQENLMLEQLQINIGFANYVSLNQMIDFGESIKNLSRLKRLEIKIVFESEESDLFDYYNEPYQKQILSQFIDLISNIKGLQYFKFNKDFQHLCFHKLIRKLKRVVIVN